MKRFCEYCGKSIEGNDEHVKNCEYNPASHRAKKAIEKNLNKEKLSKEVSDNVRSLGDIPELISRVMKKEGYEVYFESIPDRWSKKPYGRPRDVRFPNDEEIYAGWTGQWKGTITPIGDKKRLGISDLHSSWDDDKFNFPFIRTETGSSGENFSISGHILVDDFPHLHKEYLRTGFEDRVNGEMKIAISDLKKNIREEENAFVSGNDLMKVISDQLSLLEGYVSNLRQQKSSHDLALREKFRADTKIEMPDIKCPFIDMTDYLKLVARFKDKKVIVDEAETRKSVEELITLINRANKFADERLEYFI